VLDTAHDAYISFDQAGTVTAWSPQAEVIFGWSALESVGRELADLIVPASDRKAHRKSIGLFLRGAESPLLNRRLELTGRHKDGHEFPVEVAISPIELDGSWQFNAFIHDITDRRLLEARSGRLFDISLDLMCTFTPDGHLRQINKSWSRVLGWSEEELLGRPMVEFLHPDDVAGTLEATEFLRKNLRETEPGVENRWRAADGSYRWLTWSAHLSPEENLIYAVAKDVTEAKRSALLLATRYEISDAISHSETLEDDLTAVLSATGRLGWEFGAAWLPDEDGREMFCASTWTAEGVDPTQFEKFVGELKVLPNEGVVGSAWHTGQPGWLEDEREKVGKPGFPHAELAVKTGVLSAVAIPLVGADGVVSVIQLLAREPRARDEDTVQLLSTIGEEVGHVVERRIARIETDRMKDDFLALVSHELRTPLTSIVGYLELLGDDEDDAVSPTGRQFLGVIERNAYRLQRLVDDVLFATRAETGKMALAEGPLDLRSVAADSVETALPKADARGVSVVLDARRVPRLVGDPDRLGQALDNLISNALKFTPPGGRVDVVLRHIGGRAIVEVRDTGLGMSAEDQAHVFDRFFRAASTRDHAPGVGLGLTIVKAIVEGHGGGVSVESTEGAGTSFRIELPLAREPEGAQSSLLPDRP
jgi:PAS domain S-box-containing protein